MSEEECWSQLRGNKLGRVVIQADGLPHIFPVNYSVGDHEIVFRTGPGTKLTHGPGSMSCFEVDTYDHASLAGWSVMAFGPLRDVTDEVDDASKALRDLPVHPVAPGKRAHWIAMRVASISGRRFTGGWVVPGAFYG